MIAALTSIISSAASGQVGQLLPASFADQLIEDGRWAEAESALYSQSENSPRDPFARAALGRFLAMKGAVRPGIVLMEEARKFGLDATVTRRLVEPWRAILEWRAAAVELKRDTTLAIRRARRSEALFEVGMPRTDRDGRSLGRVELEWHEVVDRAIGLDSLSRRGRPMGIEIFEALSPSIDVREGDMTLHANTRSALSALGARYQVLRSPRGVMVLVGERRVLPLTDALRELSTEWWQLDLTRGLLVVR